MSIGYKYSGVEQFEVIVPYKKEHLKVCMHEATGNTALLL